VGLGEIGAVTVTRDDEDLADPIAVGRRAADRRGGDVLDLFVEYAAGKSNQQGRIHTSIASLLAVGLSSCHLREPRGPDLLEFAPREISARPGPCESGGEPSRKAGPMGRW
jgi:hypothetical protein